MICRFATMFALSSGLAGAMLTPVLALDYDFPAAYDVEGVAEKDVLNIRAEPSASAAILSEIAPDATGVEVLALSEDGKWGQVSAGEQAGWVSMRYLTEVKTSTAKGLPRPFRCSGTEPFWSLSVGAQGNGEWQTPEEPARELSLSAEGAAREGFQARFEEGPGRAFQLIATRAACSDGMSDRPYGFEARLFLESSEGNRLYSGCCTLDAR